VSATGAAGVTTSRSDARNGAASGSAEMAGGLGVRSGVEVQPALRRAKTHRWPQFCPAIPLLLPDGALNRERERLPFKDYEAEAARRERVRDDIARRIQRACAHLSDGEFRQLTEVMADRQLNAERRAAQNFWRDHEPR